MTIREVVSRLRNDLKEHTQDSVYYNRHLWNAFWTASRLLLQREADGEGIKDMRSFKSVILDTEEVNKYEGTCVPLECAVCRVKLDKPLMSKKGMVYHFVGSIDMHTEFKVVSPQDFKVKAGIKGVRVNYAYLEGDYLYLSKCTPCIKVIAVFNDFSTTNTKGSCSILDSEIGIPDYLIEGSLSLAKQHLLPTLSKAYDHTQNKNTLT